MPRTRSQSSAQRPTAHLLLFLSGAAGLVHELVWIRLAAGAFGSTTYALSTVLAVFFFGLAAGSELFGRVALRSRQPMRVYGWLELALALTAAATPWTLALAERAYGAAFRALPDGQAALAFVRAGLIALALSPPAVLMGGALPLVCRHLVRARGALGGGVARLYALNTLGAALGCVATGLWLVPSLGLRTSLFVGAGINLLIGAVALGRRWEPASAAPPLDGARGRSTAGTRRLVGALIFLVGFVALGQEVLWARFVSLFVRHGVHTTTLTLTAMLVGIVIGSLATARRVDLSASRVRAFGALQVGAGLLPLALVLPFARLFGAAEACPWVAFALLVPPAALSGACFPLAVRLVARDPESAGPATGRMAALNTLGGIVGALAIGFALLPLAGLAASAIVLAGLSVAGGGVTWVLLDAELSRARRWGMAASAALVWLALPWIGGPRVPADLLAEPGRLVDWREGLESSLAVVRADDGSLQLEIDRWWQGSDRKSHQILAAHLPALLHPRPRRVLVVGVGVGQTSERFLMHDVERLDCVDVEPAVFDLVGAHFSAGWMADPRVHVIRADGRQLIAHGAERWDLISLEVGQLFRPGAASFYAREFYELARARLEPGGLVAQFVPLDFLGLPELRRVVASFVAVFPQCSLWYNTSELLLIGTSADAFAIPTARFASVASDPALRSDLEYSHWGGPAERLSEPAALLGCFLAGPRGLAALAQDALPLRDDRPSLEYAGVRALDGGLEELPAVAALRSVAEDADDYADASLSPGRIERASELQRANLAQLEARVHLRALARARRTGRQDELVPLLQAALAAQPRDAEANRRMGDALLLERRFEEAERWFAAALAIRPTDALARRRLAKLLQLLGRAGESIAHYEALLSASAPDAEVRFLLGMALLQSGDVEGARRHVEEALRLEPGHADARAALERIGRE